MGRTIAGEHIYKPAFGFGDDAFVLLLCDLQRKGMNRLHWSMARV